mgnify:CR=1 FL=1
MKTKQVPIIITLVAGLTICIIGFVTRMETAQFVKTWAIVLVSFYILGCIAKLLLDKNFKEEEIEGATDEAAESEGEEGEGGEKEADLGNLGNSADEEEK